MENEKTSTSSSTKTIVATIAAIIFVLAVGIIYKFTRHSVQIATKYQSKTTNAPLSRTSSTPAPTVKNTNTTDAQLDADMQNIQDNLTKLDGNLDKVDQGLNNQSADTPPLN